jgi:hypothetical protein
MRKAPVTAIALLPAPTQPPPPAPTPARLQVFCNGLLLAPADEFSERALYDFALSRLGR